MTGLTSESSRTKSLSLWHSRLFPKKRPTIQELIQISPTRSEPQHASRYAGNKDFHALKYFPFGGAKRLDVVTEFFNLFNSENANLINPLFSSGLTPIPGFGRPIAGTGARQIQFSLDFEF